MHHLTALLPFSILEEQHLTSDGAVTSGVESGGARAVCRRWSAHISAERRRCLHWRGLQPGKVAPPARLSLTTGAIEQSL